MPALSIQNFVQADWDAVSTDIHTMFTNEYSHLLPTHVGQGQNGNIIFGVAYFTGVLSGGTSRLDTALARSGSALAANIDVELHGHFTLVRDPQPNDPHHIKREVSVIHFKCMLNNNVNNFRFLGAFTRQQMPANVYNHIDRQINRARWNLGRH